MKTLQTPVKRGTKPGNGKVETLIDLPALKIGTTEINIIGESPLMVLRFSKKIENQLLEKHRGKATAGKSDKDPLQLFKDAYYADGEGFLFPSVCFKAAAVNCANDIDLKQTEMRRAFHVCGEFVRIEAPPIKTPLTDLDREFVKEIKWEHEHGCSMRSDPVRNANGNPDIRIRAWFPTWRTKLKVQFNESIISLERLLMLFRAAGFGNGVGEWRPASKESKTGTFGRFRLE